MTHDDKQNKDDLTSFFFLPIVIECDYKHKEYAAPTALYSITHLLDELKNLDRFAPLSRNRDRQM